MSQSKMVYIETVKLKLNPRNPRKNDGAVETVMKSIEKYGFKNPLIADSSLIVYCGNTRLKAARKLGLKEVPVIIADDLTPEQIREFALVDNKSSELADWDFEFLNEELKELDLGDFDLDWGLGEVSVEAEEDTFDVDKEISEISEPITKPGDVWVLGRHRLICGDCTDRGVVERLMDGERADLLQTDLPYNVDYNGKTEGKLTIENDNLADEEFRELLKSAFKCTQEFLKEGAVFYVWHASHSQSIFEDALMTARLQPRQQLIWVKNSLSLGRQDYQWRHEPCFYGWKEGALHHWYSDRKQTTVLEYDKPKKNEEHPTMKPIPLIGYQIANSTKKDEIVLDVFGGSGSSLIACEQLGRICRMVEISPEYCDVIVKRWENLTKNKAVKLHCAEG